MNDTWYYIDRGEERGPVSLAKLKELRTIKVIVPDTAVRLAESQDWARAEDVPGLFRPVVQAEQPVVDMPPKLMNCEVCKGALASNAPACPHCGAPNSRAQKAMNRPPTSGTRSSWSWRRRLTTSAVLAVLALGLYLLSAILSGHGGARRALTDELDKWKSGLSSAAVQPRISEIVSGNNRVSILVDYEILNVRQITENYQCLTVNLMFSSGVGGRPIEQHEYHLLKDDASGSWKISRPYED